MRTFKFRARDPIFSPLTFIEVGERSCDGKSAKAFNAPCWVPVREWNIAAGSSSSHPRPAI